MRGYCGVAVFDPKLHSNVGTLWRSAQIYDAKYLATIGTTYKKQPSDTMKATRHMPLFHYRDMSDFIEHIPKDTILIGVELCKQATPLIDFIHPQQAVYLLGSEDRGLPSEVLNMCHEIIVIPSPQCSTDVKSLNVAVAGSVVLFDRYSKQCQR